MQCSSRKFVASQVYYGLRIAHPDWPAEKITDAVIDECDLLIHKLDKAKKKKTKK
jgi:hypothetical protein